MTDIRSVIVSLLLTAAAFGQHANAHELGIARLLLDWQEPGILTLQARIPAEMSSLLPRFPDRCTVTDAAVRPGAFGDVAASWTFDCGPNPPTASDVILFDWALDGVFIANTEGDVEGRFVDAGEEGIVLPLQELLATENHAGISFSQYFTFGVEHILSGWDHLAFVLALCLIATGWRLIKLVTAFTVGHSVTLGLASVGLIAVPAPPLEALIALSIAFMAREAILRENESQGYAIVLAFGLLHGLGFAGALSEFGLRTDSLLKALLAFNLGVEAGQLIFVLAAVSVLMLARRLLRPTSIRYAVAHSIGILAIFWTVERIAGFTV
jgi:hydrogenase/urease accessory protein HupE